MNTDRPNTSTWQRLPHECVWRCFKFPTSLISIFLWNCCVRHIPSEILFVSLSSNHRVTTTRLKTLIKTRLFFQNAEKKKRCFNNNGLRSFITSCFTFIRPFCLNPWTGPKLNAPKENTRWQRRSNESFKRRHYLTVCLKGAVMTQVACWMRAQEIGIMHAVLWTQNTIPDGNEMAFGNYELIWRQRVICVIIKMYKANEKIKMTKCESINLTLNNKPIF